MNVESKKNHDPTSHFVHRTSYIVLRKSYIVNRTSHIPPLFLKIPTLFPVFHGRFGYPVINPCFAAFTGFCSDYLCNYIIN